MKQAAKHVKSRDFRVSQKIHKKISTHLLTVLTISVILQLEQRKGDRKRESGEIPGCVPFQRFQRNKVFKKKKER